MINISWFVREGLTGPLLDMETTSPSGRLHHLFRGPTGTIFLYYFDFLAFLSEIVYRQEMGETEPY